MLSFLGLNHPTSFIDPTLLRLIPLVSSTIALQFAYDEYTFLSNFTQPAISSSPTLSSHAASVLPVWFKRWGGLWGHGVWVILICFPVTIISGLANYASLGPMPLMKYPSHLLSTRGWYAAGTLFATAHLLGWGNKALGLLERIWRDEPEGSAMPALEEWLEMHWTRSWAVDVPAFLCFLLGAWSSLEMKR